MNKLRNRRDDWSAEDFEDPGAGEIDLPARIQARWLRSGELRRMPREREVQAVHRSKPHRDRRHAG